VVPGLRCREDPLPQTPYVGFDLGPINGRPVQAVVLRSVHHGVAVASNVSIGSGVVGHHHSTGPPGHVSDPLGPRHQPLSGQLCETAPEERPCLGFLSPFGHRPSLLGHPFPAGGLGLPCGQLTGTRHVPDPDGVSMLRTDEVRPEWVPSIPRGQRCPCERLCATVRRLPRCSGSVPSPRSCSHRRGLH
jgi:hypothetical protein